MVYGSLGYGYLSLYFLKGRFFYFCIRGFYGRAGFRVCFGFRICVELVFLGY